MRYTANSIANLLISLECLQIRPADPFTYASGLKGPIYCDNRQILSYPKERTIIIDAFVEMIKKLDIQFDAVAGLATAGIPHAALIADRLECPMIYIRSKAKGHGKQNQVEGAYSSGQKILLIEDLVNQGSSLGEAVKAARNVGLDTVGCACIVDYETKAAKTIISDLNIDLYSLTNFTQVALCAKESGELGEENYQLLMSWHTDPKSWK